VCRESEDLATRYPAVDATAVVANQEPIALACFHQVQILVAATTNEYNVANCWFTVAQRLNGHVVSIVHPTRHRVPARPQGDRLTALQTLDRVARPTHQRKSRCSSTRAEEPPQELVRLLVTQRGAEALDRHQSSRLTDEAAALICFGKLNR